MFKARSPDNKRFTITNGLLVKVESENQRSREGIKLTKVDDAQRR